ncbi:MAG: hypothetical protein ACLR02_14900 [Clostridium sp.]
MQLINENKLKKESDYLLDFSCWVSNNTLENNLQEIEVELWKEDKKLIKAILLEDFYDVYNIDIYNAQVRYFEETLTGAEVVIGDILYIITLLD